MPILSNSPIKYSRPSALSRLRSANLFLTSMLARAPICPSTPVLLKASRTLLTASTNSFGATPYPIDNGEPVVLENVLKTDERTTAVEVVEAVWI